MSLMWLDAVAGPIRLEQPYGRLDMFKVCAMLIGACLGLTQLAHDKGVFGIERS